MDFYECVELSQHNSHSMSIHTAKVSFNQTFGDNDCVIFRHSVADKHLLNK